MGTDLENYNEKTKETTTSIFDETDVPIPEYKEKDLEENTGVKIDTIDFDTDDMLSIITSMDEDGHSPCTIIAELNKLHNVKEDTLLEDLTEDDYESIDSIVIEDCAVDMYSLENGIINVILKFDNNKDVYLQELNELLNRYRAMKESMNPEIEPNTVIMFSISFSPNALGGQGVMTYTFPIGYFKTLDDNNENCCIHMLFHEECLICQKLELDKETVAEIYADELRKSEEGTGGYLYES